jgi:[ribosomal protein S5]-alanine N-acetyltransferase
MNLPPYNNFPELMSGRIKLRAIQQSDIEDLVDISYYDAIQATSLQDAVAMQEKINNDYQKGNSIHWGIEEQTSGNIVGTCGYYRGLDKGKGELGCILLPAYRGSGFMTNALQLAIGFGLQTIGLASVMAITSAENQAAKKLLHRLGFVAVGKEAGNEIEFEFRQ